MAQLSRPEKTSSGIKAFVILSTLSALIYAGGTHYSLRQQQKKLEEEKKEVAKEAVQQTINQLKSLNKEKQNPQKKRAR